MVEFASSKQVQRNTNVCLQRKQSSEIQVPLSARSNDKIKFICMEVHWKGLSRSEFMPWRAPHIDGIPINLPRMLVCLHGGRGLWFMSCGSVASGRRHTANSPWICCETKVSDSFSVPLLYHTKNLCLTEIPSQLREITAKNQNGKVFFFYSSLLGLKKEI